MNGQRTSPNTATLRSLGTALRENGGGHTPLGRGLPIGGGHTPLGRGLHTPPPTAPGGTARAAPLADLHASLAAKDSELALLRQQLAQLTSDFKYNLKLLEERDLELERLEAVTGGLKDTAAAKELALAETKRLLAEKDTALREKESRVAVLEERQRQTAQLCERQVADARSARDEEVAKCQARCRELEEQLAERIASVEGIASREKADIIAGYEEQLGAAMASEREARAAASAARQEGEAVRSQLQRVEAKAAEQELAMQRMVTQFEGALQTLQQLEGQYNALASESATAERARISRIQQLEADMESLRAARAAVQQELEARAASLEEQLAEREKQLTEVKQRCHRSSLEAAELTEALTKLKGELAAAKSQAQRAEEELAAACDRRLEAQSALDRECSAHAQTRGLLESTRLHLETAKRDGQAQAQEVCRLKEAVALLDAQCLDATKALEAANAKLRASDERMQLLGQQVEQERASHARALAAQEEALLAQAECAVGTLQEEKASLQQALELANRQLQQSYRDLETLRLQLEHVKLAPPPPVAGAAGAAGGSSQRHVGSPLQRRSTGGSSGGQEAGLLGRYHPGTQHAHGGGRYGDSHQDTLSEEGASSSTSGDVFDGIEDSSGSLAALGAAGRQQQSSWRLAAHPGGANTGAYAERAQQRQAHNHLDSLSSKLSSFERAAERARHVGSQAASQVQRSAEELPQGLQRRQSEVTEGVLKQKLAREREGFRKERQRLDEELQEKEQLLAEREQELQRLQKEREAETLRQKQEELAQREAELAVLAQRLEEQAAQVAVLAGAPASATAAAGPLPPSPAAQLQQAQHGGPATAAEHRYRPAAVGASVEASVAGTAPPSPASQPPLQHPAPSAYYRPSQAPVAAAAPAGGSGRLQQLRASAQLTAGGGGQLADAGGGAQPPLAPLRRSAPVLHVPPPGAAPGRGAPTFRSSLGTAQAGQQGGSWGTAGPSASLGPRLALGTLPRGSTEGLYTPRDGALHQPLSARASTGLQGGLLGPRMGSAGAGPAPGAPSARSSPGPVPAAWAGGEAAGDGEDPLAKARRQVMLAKEYLRQVADMGGKLSRGQGGSS